MNIHTPVAESEEGEAFSRFNFAFFAKMNGLNAVRLGFKIYNKSSILASGASRLTAVIPFSLAAALV